MTILAADGMFDRLQDAKWTMLGTPIQGWTTGRHSTGPTGKVILGSASSSPGSNALVANFDPEQVVFAGTSLRHDGTTSSGDNRAVIALRDGSGEWLITVNHYVESGVIEFRQGPFNGTLLASLPTEPYENKHVIIEANATAGHVSAYLNGELVAFADGLTIDPAAQLLVSGTNRVSQTNRATAHEDVWAATENLGDARIVPVQPDAAGNAAEWAPSDGVSPNWELVSGIPPDLAEYVSTDTDGARDSLGVEALFSDPDRPEVLAVIPTVRASKTDSVEREISAGLRVGTTYYDGTPVAIDGTVAARHILEQNPDTLADWQPSEIDGVEVTYVATKPV